MARTNETDYLPKNLTTNGDNETYTVDRSMVIMGGWCEFLVCIIGTPANLLVLYVWATAGRRSDNESRNSYENRTHNNNHWFILGLTTADLLFCSVHAPVIFSILIYRVDYSLPICLFFVMAVTHTATTTSSINLLFLTIDKFLYLSKPLRYYNLVTTKRAVMAMLLAWGIGMSWAGLFAYGPLLEMNETCASTTIKHPLEYIIFSVIFFMLPIACSFAMSVYIAIIAIRAKTAFLKYSPSELSLKNIKNPSTKSRSSTSTITANFHKLVQIRAHFKTIYFVFVASMWCTATCLPYRILFTLQRMGQFPLSIHAWSFYISFCGMVMTAAGNPFITLLTQPHYRHHFLGMIRCKQRNCDNNGAGSLKNGTSMYSEVDQYA